MHKDASLIFLFLFVFRETPTDPCSSASRFLPRSNQILQYCSMVRSWPSLCPQTRYPAVMTLRNHAPLASVHINTSFTLNVLLDISQYLFAAATTVGVLYES